MRVNEKAHKLGWSCMRRASFGHSDLDLFVTRQSRPLDFECVREEAKLFESHFSDPLPIIPNRFERDQVSAVKYILAGSGELSLLEIVVGVAGANGHKLQNAGIAVAIDHAPGAAIADQLGRIEFIDVAHRRFPEVAAVQVQVPVELEILVAAETAKSFLLAPQMALHFRERLGRVDHWITAALLHLFDFLKNLKELLRAVTDQI
jgi:hypothetical protein